MWAMTPRHDKRALQRLGTVVIRRRTELKLNKVDVARAAGMQVNTYSKVEEGIPVRPTTYSRIEPILGWGSGSCLDVLGGGAPTLTEPSVENAVISPVRPEDLAAEVGAAVQDAALSVSDTLTAAEIRELKRRVVSEVMQRLEKHGIDRN